MSTFVLWDIDGTLIQNTPSAGTLYLDAIEHVTGVRPTVPVADPHGMTEGQLLTELMTLNGLDPARLHEVLFDLDALSREQHLRGWDRDPCAGVDAALAAVAERGWVNALLTGNGPNRARYKLLAAGIDPELFDWDHSYFGHESPTRHHLTAGARSALAEHTAVIVGDTPNDGLAADSAHIPFLAVATGVYSADELRPTNAVVVIDDLETGLPALLEAIDSRTVETTGTPVLDGDATDELDAVAETSESDEPAADATQDAEPDGDAVDPTEAEPEAAAEPEAEAESAAEPETEQPDEPASDPEHSGGEHDQDDETSDTDQLNAVPH